MTFKVEDAVRYLERQKIYVAQLSVSVHEKNMNKYQAEAVEKGGSKRNKKLVIEPKQFSQMNKHLH